MKLKLILVLILVAALAGGTGWFAAKRTAHEKPTVSSGARKILYYQSPMHPWITSPTPGRCTICGMKLEAFHYMGLGAPVLSAGFSSNSKAALAATMPKVAVTVTLEP